MRERERERERVERDRDDRRIRKDSEGSLCLRAPASLLLNFGFIRQARAATRERREGR